MTVTRRVKTFAALGVALAAVAAGLSLALFRSSPKPLSLKHPIRVTLASGCPARVAGFDGASNPDSRGLDRLLVPKEPTRGLICHFSPVLASGSGGDLSTSIRLAGAEAKRVASDLDEISPYQLKGAINCPASSEQLFDVIALGYAGRSDVDVWFARSGCIYIDNGFIVRMRITPRIAAQFDTLANDLNKLITSG